MEEKGESVFSAHEMGRRIAQRRKQMGLTQEQLAEMSGLSHQFFSSVETGAKNIRAENVVKLCRVLQVSADYILTGRSNEIDTDNLSNMLRRLDAVSYTHLASFCTTTTSSGVA